MWEWFKSQWQLFQQDVRRTFGQEAQRPPVQPEPQTYSLESHIAQGGYDIARHMLRGSVPRDYRPGDAWRRLRERSDDELMARHGWRKVNPD